MPRVREAPSNRAIPRGIAVVHLPGMRSRVLHHLRAAGHLQQVPGSAGPRQQATAEGENHARVRAEQGRNHDGTRLDLLDPIWHPVRDGLDSTPPRLLPGGPALVLVTVAALVGLSLVISGAAISNHGSNLFQEAIAAVLPALKPLAAVPEPTSAFTEGMAWKLDVPMTSEAHERQARTLAMQQAPGVPATAFLKASPGSCRHCGESLPHHAGGVLGW